MLAATISLMRLALILTIRMLKMLTNLKRYRRTRRIPNVQYQHVQLQQFLLEWVGM